MKLLLTSQGLTNTSIVNALSELTGKKPEETKVVFIPTASIYFAENKSWLVKIYQRIIDAGYFLDIIHLGVLPKEIILKRLEASDVIFVGGGSTPFLSYWFQKIGLFEELPKLLRSKVYVGQSAGSVIVSATMQASSSSNALLSRTRVVSEAMYDEETVAEQASEKTLKLVDFCVRPHYNSPSAPKVIDEVLERVAEGLDVPMYAIDDQTAIKVDGDRVEVVSEGEWKLFE